MDRLRAQVVVIGGGLAGLTVGYRLLQRGLDVRVCESDARPGGQLHTVAERGLVVEIGAEGFVARSTAVPSLCAELGIGGALIDQNTTTTFIAEGETLTELAPGAAGRMLGFQVPAAELGRGIRSLRAGMGQLSGALADALGSRLTLNQAAIHCGPSRASALRVDFSSGWQLECDRVVIATPARTAAALLAPAAPAAASLGDSRVLSSLSVILAYDSAHVARRPVASGFIAARPHQRFGFRACSFVDCKFDGRAPPGTILLRTFFRPDPEELHDPDDAEWTTRAVDCIRAALQICGSPQRSWVARWNEALPVHDSEHQHRVNTVERSIHPLGLWLAGAAFHGAGIDAAVNSAEAAARHVLRSFSVPTPP